MWSKGIVYSALVVCICQQVNSQWQSGNSTTAASTTTTSHSSLSSSNQTGSVQANETNVAPVTQFMRQILRGEVWGVRKCKKPKDCGLGLRCDVLLNLCVPLNTPILSDIEKPCLNQSDCSRMHACQGGFCRFCGPKSCRSTAECCAGSFAQGGQPGRFFECLNIEDNEKLALAKQLGRVPPNYQPQPKVAGGKSPEDQFEVESEELLQLGQTAQGDQALYGKRCWARCNVDNDCYHVHGDATEEVKKHLGCCNGVCTRRQSCVSASPQAIQHLQLLQQQQQQFNLQQQQQHQQQQQLLHPHSHHQGAQQSHWAAQSHTLQQPQLQPQLQWEPRPLSWQDAQHQKPTLGQQQATQQNQQPANSAFPII